MDLSGKCLHGSVIYKNYSSQWNVVYPLMKEKKRKERHQRTKD
jgi:hypothetical protein